MKKLGLGLLVLLYFGSINVIKAQPIIRINPVKSCINGSIISLNNYVTVDGVFKAGGIWTSPSAGLIWGDKFNPVAAGVSTPPGWKVKYEYTDPISGLYAKDSSYVTIFALPKPYAGKDDSLCSGTKITLAGTPSSPPGTWQGTGVEDSSPNWKFNPDTIGIVDGGTYKLIYHYTDTNQCENDDTLNFTVYKTPVVDAGNPMDFCIDASAMTLTGLPAGGIWTGKGIAGNQFHPSLATPGVHDLTYTYTNVICTVRDKVNYSVWDLPLVTANTQSGQTYFCRYYGLVQLNGQPGGAGGIWSGPGISGNTFNTRIGADALTQYQLRYEYTDNHKCKNKADMILWVKPEPIVVIDPSTYCFGYPYIVSAKYNHAEGLFWWKGAQSDGNITGDPASSGISYEPGANDSTNLYFWLYVKTTHSDNICAPAFDSIKVPMRARPTAIPIVTLTPSDSFLECDLTNGTYIWYYRPDMSTPPKSSHNSRRINPQLLCNRCYFSVVYFNSDGCPSDTSAPYYYIGNSIEQNNHNSQFQLYPNPAHGLMQIENPGNEPVMLMISDIFGKNLSQQNVMPGKNNLNISSLKPGIYILRLNDSFIYKLVVE